MEPEVGTRRVAFNVDRFLKLKRKGDKFEGMAFELAERAITLRVGNTSFGLPVYEPEGSEVPLPSISGNDLAADVPTADLLEAVRSFSGLTDRVELMAPDCDRILVRGSCDSYSSQGETKEVTVITSSKASPSIESAKYDVDRLFRVLMAMKPMAEIITLRWGKDLPLELTVKAPASPVLSLKSWLASLIES